MDRQRANSTLGMATQIKPAANKVLPKAGLKYFYEAFAQN